MEPYILFTMNNLQYFLHLNKQKMKLGLHSKKQVRKAKRFDENAAQEVNNFHVLIFDKNHF